MRVLDPGHSYELRNLDEFNSSSPVSYLVFVKREGLNYPGNEGSYSGTTLQEVLRACTDRLRYVNHQLPDKNTKKALGLLRLAILCLERRAAKRHHRNGAHLTLDEAEFGRCCSKCNHVGCEGGCH